MIDTRGAQHMFFKNKKGDLSLSINAIVILILAITMLGLGLGFMKGMFGKTLGQFEDIGTQIKNQVIEEVRSSNSRMAFYQEDIQVKRNEKKELYFGIKNDGQTGEKTFAIFTGCGQSLAGENFDPLSIKLDTLKSKTVPQGEVAVMKIIINPSSQAISSSYTCQICITEDTLGETNLNGPGEVESRCSPSNPSYYTRKEFYITIP